MVGITTLWLPIVLSAVIVFLASAIAHMVLRYHWSDMSKMPGEDRVMEAIRREGVPRGDYVFPHAASPAEMGAPGMAERFKQGPVGIITILRSGPPAMGRSLAQWFVFTLVVGVFVAYVTGRALTAGTDYLQVFRVAGTVAFLTYAGAEPVESIWKGRRWSTTLKNVLDGLAYALLTAGMFGWLWPR